MENFPERLDPDEVENMVREGELNDFETFSDLNTAKLFAKTFEKGLSGKETQVYTQVDIDDGGYSYLKSEHYANRTGVYMVAWK